jgi:membrane protein implicated in regulation of membrane protease activity
MQQQELGGYLGSTLTAALAAVQTNEVFQIIEVILACVSFAVSIAYTIWKWYKRAKSQDSDGGSNITQKEVVNLIDDLHEHIKEGENHGDRD